MEKFYVYILASKKNGTLYTGFTNDLTRRTIEHKLKYTPGFTSKYGVDKLVYYEEFDNSYEAFERERRLKKWPRAWKIRLIEKENPEWKDLAEDWLE
jgi:putative endonuclease